MAEQARRNLDDAAAAQASAAAPVHPDVAEALSQGLAKFAPETTPAVDAIDQQLTPALREFRQAADAGGPQAADAAADHARRAIDAAQAALRLAQDALIERDPVASARYDTQAAADELARRNADFESAGAHQRRASQAMGRAWGNSIHAAAGGRLMQVPSLSALLDEFPFDVDAGALAAVPGAAARALFPALPSVREWGRLRSRDNPEGINTSVRETAPAGYEDALGAYFEALSKAKGVGNK